LASSRTILLAFIGLIVGVVLGFAGSTLGYRYGFLHVPGERPFERMARVLDLTPAQREQMRNVMHDTRDKVEAARDNFERQRHQLFVGAYMRTRAMLTPEQRKVFDSQFVPPGIKAAAQAEAQDSELAPMATPEASSAGH
jgi:Spy/CpxP family protein refolding chaperone